MVVDDREEEEKRGWCVCFFVVAREKSVSLCVVKVCEFKKNKQTNEQTRRIIFMFFGLFFFWKRQEESFWGKFVIRDSSHGVHNTRAKRKKKKN